MRRSRRAFIGVTAVLALPTAAVVAVVVLYTPEPSHTCRTISSQATAARSTAGRLRPMGLAWANDVLFVADAERGTIERHAPDGAVLSNWGGLGRPVAVAARAHLAYVADFLGDRVIAMGQDGRLVRAWGSRGHGPGQFDAPSGIAVDGTGRVYVTDLYNHRVQVFTEDGRFLRQWGSKGRRGGELSFPTGIAVSAQGEVLVADGFNHRVQRFTLEGDFRGKWGGMGYGIPGSWPGWFALSKDVAFGPTGTVYVSDAFNGRVQAFTPEGKLLAVWRGQEQRRRQVRYTSGLAVGSDGAVYVGDFHGEAIWKLRCL